MSTEPIPPTPDAPDERVERAARAGALTYHGSAPAGPLLPLWRSVARAALDAAGVPTLDAEVERLRGHLADMEEQRDDWTQEALAAQARAVSAEQELAGLRERVEAFDQDRDLYADLEQACAEGAGNPSTLADKVQDIMADRLRAALAEPGGQVGEGRQACRWDSTLGVTHSVYCGGRCDRSRPAPVVPDSAGLREALHTAIGAVRIGLLGLGPDAVHRVTEAVLAVVRPTVTGEFRCDWDGCGGHPGPENYCSAQRRYAPSTTTEGN